MRNKNFSTERKKVQDDPQKQLIYGTHAALECIKNPIRKINKIYCSDNIFNKYHIFISKHQHFICSTKELDYKFGNYNHQGIVVETKFLHQNFHINICKDFSKIVILDKLQDPNNIGSIMRCAVAFGIECIILPNRNSPIYSYAISHVASGAEDHIKVLITPNLTSTVLSLKKIGFWVVGLDSNSTTSIEKANPDILQKVSLVFGSEGKGISTLLKSHCDQTYTIPIKSGPINSLNVSNASAITFFALTKMMNPSNN
jgi:23S rRNA (guanosine2251-2'-O)-methyltransferase